MCHGAPNSGWETCYSCFHVMGQLTRPCSLVVPISLSEPFGQLHHVLKHYKNPDMDPVTRGAFILQVTGILARFLSAHRSCIERSAKREWNLITIVPSTSGRSGEHPLETAIRRSPWLRSQFENVLFPGSVAVTHNQASNNGFAALAKVKDRSVLLIDDTFTSGSRCQSAASALSLAGANVVAIVPLARIIRIDWSEECEALWNRSRKRQYDFKYCCVGDHSPPPKKKSSREVI